MHQPKINGIKVFKVFNRLPGQIKQLSHDTKQFKIALKDFCISILFTRWINISNTKLVKF
jgi:hypothetical protein